MAQLIVLNLGNLLHFVADEFIQDGRYLVHLVDRVLVHKVGEFSVLRCCPMVEFGFWHVSVIALII